MLKSCPLKSQIYAPDYPYDAEVANNLIYVLLNALIAKPVELPEEGNASPESNPDTSSATDQPSPLRDVSGTDLLPTDDDDGLVIPLSIPNVDGFNDSTESISSPREGSRLTKDASKDSKSESSSMKNIPIIRKSGICRILAELVRSYSQCARMITDYSFHAGDSELVTEDCTALAFILDNLLHSSQTAGDKETPALARILIAAIASCNHCSEAQTTLVNEVRFALLRALSLPESAEKHARIQALTGLISTMIESCPSTSSQNQLGGCALRSQSSSMNNIVRLFLRKGIVVDLARIPHYLDLSSPHMATTVNCALKPLETLSRIVNLPSGGMTNKSKAKSSSGETRDSVPEAMEEDTSSGRCSTGLSILPYRAGHAEDVTMDPALEGLMNEILDGHENCGDNEDQIPSDAGVEAGEQDITVTVEMEDHSSAPTGSRHSNSFGNQTQDEQQESSDSESNSESGHSHSEDDADRDERTDDAEDEDDEEEDNSRFDGGDDYTGVDFFRVEDREDNLFFQLEEVFSSSGSSSVIFGGTDAVRTFQIPVVTDETTTGSENPAPTVPPAPRSVTAHHPLLVRHGASPCSSLGPRLHRRQRGYRPIVHHTYGLYAPANGNSSSRQPNPPVILQSSHSSSAAPSRVVFANSDFRILAAEDEVFDPQDHERVPGENTGYFS
ncbi:E3 ubiquitin-protein ligase HUWE1, partial [Stegodyphus mimosarum]